MRIIKSPIALASREIGPESPDTEDVSFSYRDLAIDKNIRKTKGGGPWIFKTDAPVTVVTDILGITFRSRWLTVEENGTIAVSAEYAWDGNSKKISVFDLFVIGTPDGIVDVRTMKPKTWYASLVHDALYQYYGYHGIARKDMDAIYRALAREANFAPADLYWLIVRICGGLFFLGKKRRTIVYPERTLELDRDFLGRERTTSGDDPVIGARARREDRTRAGEPRGDTATPKIRDQA
jgi:hypothetical protein